MSESNIADWVWFYYNQGLNVIPLTQTDPPSEDNKKPNISWKEYIDKRITKEEIQEWLDKGLFQNIGIICGNISNNLVIIDIDDNEVLDKLELKTEKLIETNHWVVKTKKGYHIYCRNHGDTGNRNDHKDIHIDYRANKNYCVAPPSIHPTGDKYVFLNGEDPNKLTDLSTEDVKKVFNDMIEKLGGAKKEELKWVKDKVGSVVEQLKNGLDEGGRNDAAFIVASHYRDKGLTRKETTVQMQNWNSKNNPPLKTSELETCIRSSFNYEAKEEKLQRIKKETINIGETTLWEPILNNSEPKWLVIKKTPDGNIFDVQLPDIWICKNCSTTQQSKEDPTVCINCSSKHPKFERLTNKINTKRWKLPRWKDIPLENLDMLGTFIDLKNFLKRGIVFPDELDYDFFALWIMASYKRETFRSISFLMFQGLIESGKTRGLDLLRELGYQMIHTTGVTFPCMCRYTDKWHAGILIDEIDNKIDKRTESGRQYLDFLKPSYKRGSIYATADIQDQDETREYANYGFKAFAGERGGGDLALRSRCITFKMEQGFPEIKDLEYVQDELDDMQNILLNYRYKFNEPEPLPEDFDLKGRDRELFGCIIQTAVHIGLDYEDIIKFIKNRTIEQREAIQESDEYIILKSIYQHTVNETLLDAPEDIKYSEIVEACGWNDGTETSKKKGQRIGYILSKKLQLKTKRRTQGYVLLLNNNYNSRRLSNLYRRYYVK